MIPLFTVAVIIFVCTYVIIISEKIHRTVVALSGAVLMILLSVITQEKAIEGIDFNTIGLLIGMMIIVGIARESGMFQYVALKAAQLAKGNPRTIFVLLSIIVAVFSAFLDNVTTVLLMVPVTFVIAHNLKIHPKPFLITTILLSNIGGTATFIGDPPNILIGSAAGLNFNDFIVHLAPIATIVSVATVLLLYFWYKKTLVTTPEASASIMAFEPKAAIVHKSLLIKSLVVLGVVIAGFVTHSVTHIEGATIALAGAALLLLLTMNDPEPHLKEVEWTTIFFFIGLFILVTGLEEVGAIRLMAEKLIAVTGGNKVTLLFSLLWGSAFFSSVIDNIPFVATMIPLIKDIGALTGAAIGPLWWALALGADIGGNATIIGASANVVVSGIAKKEGYEITFVDYLKIAVPTTVVGLILCSIYLYFRYV